MVVGGNGPTAGKEHAHEACTLHVGFHAVRRGCFGERLPHFFLLFNEWLTKALD